MNPAAAFDAEARRHLAEVEGLNADAEDRNVRRHAYSASALCRILGHTPSQWNAWTRGHKSPSYRTMLGWLVRWEDAGYPAITITITSKGAL